MTKSEMYYNLVKRAVVIRMERGETFDEILKSYPRLPKNLREQLAKEFAEA